MRKRRNINVDEDEDTSPGALGPVLTIETLQSLVEVGVAYWGVISKISGVHLYILHNTCGSLHMYVYVKTRQCVV